MHYKRPPEGALAAISKDQDRRHNLFNPTPLFGSTVLEEIRALVESITSA